MIYFNFSVGIFIHKRIKVKSFMMSTFKLKLLRSHAKGDGNLESSINTRENSALQQLILVNAYILIF